MVIFSLVTIGLLLGILNLIPVGLRAGDRSHEAFVLRVRPQVTPRALKVWLVNPGDAPVIAALSVRRPGLRLRLEGGSYVRIRRGTSADLLPGRQAAIGAVAPGETGSFTVPIPARAEGRAELVALVGQTGRLRALHRLVALPRVSEAAEPETARLPPIRATVD